MSTIHPKTSQLDVVAFLKAHDSNPGDYRLERDRRKWYQVLITIFEGGVY